MKNFMPKISVITVSLNSKRSIETSIISVLSQKYSNIEYIIIDGGSTDGTIEIIKLYANKILSWISEPDDGIYHAMNKGILKSTGEWIYFLGSDDSLYNDSVISEIVKIIQSHPNTDLICGKVMAVDTEIGFQRPKGYPANKKSIISGKFIPHQGIFVKADIMRKHMFDTSLKLAGDFKFIIECVLNQYQIYSTELIIAYYSLNGKSNSSLVYKESAKAIKCLLGQKSFFQFQIFRIKNRLIRLTKKILCFFGLMELFRKRQGWALTNKGD